MITSAVKAMTENLNRDDLHISSLSVNSITTVLSTRPIPLSWGVEEAAKSIWAEVKRRGHGSFIITLKHNHKNDSNTALSFSFNLKRQGDGSFTMIPYDFDPNG